MSPQGKDIAAIRQYTQNSQLLNAHGHLEYVPLHIAAHLSLEEGAKILLECGGALRESREYQNYTPFLAAVERNQAGMVMLLDDGAALTRFV